MNYNCSFILINCFYNLARNVDYSSLCFKHSYRPSGSSIVRSLALVGPCLGLFLFVPAFLSSRFFATLLLLLLCLFLPLVSHPCCCHARGILCGMHTSCMGSPYPIFHAKWPLVIRWPCTNKILIIITINIYQL